MTRLLTITPLPYYSDPGTYFYRLRQRPDAILLDSGQPQSPSGRYDIISSDPLATLTIDQTGQIHCPAISGLSNDPLKAQQELLTHLDIEAPATELPFTGGVIGYWSYDFARLLEQLPDRAANDIGLPLARLGLYDWALIQDHERHESWLIADSARRREIERWLAGPAPREKPFRLASPFVDELPRKDYGEQFARVMAHLNHGDCYQINLARRFSTRYSGDLWQAYQRLRAATPMPYAGFWQWHNEQTGTHQALLSVSPERFLEARAGHLHTRPIKGTRPRGTTIEEDEALARSLKESPKDLAENVMIVDLLRNDLGRVCRPGSVNVPSLASLESYANVHHLVSVIEGELAPGFHSLDALMAAFPGGSITGAPKHQAMTLIDELEPVRRSAWCGSLGYVDIRGRLDSSIMIRTVVADRDHLYLWGGGGLVADSREQEEFEEIDAKVGRLMHALSASD
ncbi:anthranilate synthase component I family protein [Kushneria phosphatilytica]|uniref:Anthranilate synthase component I family protein n=1 Tax=Kushneria phosphatilytica TaxID=657387 RepID=A0A1S1NV18_9GAMM|nr:anthranilate synthase component I family protein [Kushneria phosphatilytica]OHV10242.1 aminodeoxychorismate synthase component I [Kushneria phosphatilytica]QEL11540.1 anthranilate synthase component I family protein [Kushneria phosphatilytica]